MVLVEKWTFFQLFFQGIQTRKMPFTIFQNEKMPFQAIKTRKAKSRKIDISLKGLNHGFGAKMAIFLTFFFLGNIDQENFFYDILERKKMLFQGIKTRSSKSRKIDIFLKGLTHGLGPKITIFPTVFFFQVIKTRKMPFTIFQNEKMVFQAIKRRCS